MNKLTYIIISILTSGRYTSLRDETSMDDTLRLIILNITYTIASVLITTLGILDMRKGNVDEGLIQVILGFMTFLNLFLLRTELPFIFSGLIINTIYGLFCGVSIFIKYEMHGLSGLWIYSYPLMTIFTLGLPAGLIPAIIILIAAGIGTFGGLSKYTYTAQEALLLCGVYLFVMILTVVYEYVRSFKERWLARQDRYMNLVFDNSPDVIMLLDKNVSLVHCAKVFLQRAKIGSFEEIRNESYYEVFFRFTDMETLNEIIAYFRASKEEKKPVTFERVLDFGNDGNPRHYEIHYTPMYNNSGEFQGAFILFHDMTEVLDAKDRAEQASRAKSNFLANMSHEIRTPMNAIFGMTAIAKDSDDPKRKDYCLEKIESASRHLLGIINDILDMSKIEEDKFELSYIEFELSALIQRVENIFEFRLGEKKQKLIIEQDPSLPQKIITDDQRLAQVITNLVGNSVKFTPEGGSITLSFKRLEDKEPDFCTLEVKVSDTGIGIPKEHQSKLFDSFMQLDSGIARKYGGTGLGLAISKRIVELMQGHIHIDSEPGKGSTFTFTVRAEIGTSQTQASDADAPEKEAQAGDYRGKRILLAEDVEINREIVITILEPLGLEITEAEDGQKAYELFRANPDGFDLIFMDIHMPGVDGYEATKLIRAFEAEHNKKTSDKNSSSFTEDETRGNYRNLQKEKNVIKEEPNIKTSDKNSSSFTEGETRGYNWDLHKQIPIIAMTANVFRDDIEHCLTAGMNGHIGKPLDFGAVMDVLKEYLSD